MIRLVEKEDLGQLAKIYKDLYDNVDIGETWTIEKSYDMLMYWYEKQKDLFFVCIQNEEPVGAIVSGVKSWFDGLRLVDTELFVSKKYQNKHIAKKLMIEHLKQAKIKYNVTMIEFHTYGAENEFPQNWYKRIGLEKDEELIIMNGSVEEILNKLESRRIEKNTEYKKDVMNYSYTDLSELYSNLEQGDVAYIFDMLPEYAYIDSLEEKEYINSRIKAMKNGAKVFLFVVGSKERLNKLKENELFNYSISNCFKNSKIYVIDEKEIKEKCLNEYFQLAQGLYYGERNDGTKEAFRDLWITKDNVGLLIKDESILELIKKSIDSIVEKMQIKS